MFTGTSFTQSLGFGWLDAIHPEDRAATVAAWTTAQQTGEYYIEHRIRRSSTGEYRWHQTRAKPIHASQGDSDWVGTSSDIHDMRGLQDRQKVLLGELQHRTRNLLAVVQAIERKTLRNSASLEEFSLEFEGRLRALSRVQALLAEADYGAIDLRALILAELAAHGDGGGESSKFRLEGPNVLLPANSAQTMALALHELATNAVKYGALKQTSGRLAVTWHIEDRTAAPRRVVLEWRESGVEMRPGVRPARRGYGSELIERALPYQLNAETRLDFGADGVCCRIAAVLPREETAGV